MWGMEVHLHASFTPTGDGDEQSDSCLGERASGTRWKGWWVGPDTVWVKGERKKSYWSCICLCPWKETNPTRTTEWAVPLSLANEMMYLSPVDRN